MASKRSPAKSHKSLATEGEIEKILEGHFRPKRHSDGKVPWQLVLADYCVRFSKKGREDSGTWGIYLRAYNVRLATFADNSAFLRDALARMFDAAHAQAESWKAAGKRVKGNHNR